MSQFSSNQSILRRLKNDSSISEYDKAVLKSVYVVPTWMAAINSLRWLFFVLPLVSMRAPIWLSILLAVMYVLTDRSIPGLAEKALLAMQTVAIILSVVRNGLFYWFSISFLLFIVWYVGSWIASARWFREREYILKAYSEQSPGNES